jgi:single-stranded-DNA-specific exonuclease
MSFLENISDSATNLGKSFLGFSWQQKKIDFRLALAIKQKLNLSEVLSKIISAKITASEITAQNLFQNHKESTLINIAEIESFLNPRIKSILPNPSELLDMDLGVSKVMSNIKNRKKITIFADYDVDGAASAAIFKRFFNQIGLDIGIYIPDRINEGYGPNSSALIMLKKSGVDLVITLDCGTTAFKPLKAAREAGLEIIVIDHHLGVLEKPAAIAVINPNRIDENFAHKNICAAGVSFLFIVALNKALREEGYYKINKIEEPKLLMLLDLVALGTICDVMPLKGLNRALVSQGLKILKRRKNLGLKILCDKAGLNEEPSAYHLGFVIGPRINAGGRVGKSDLGARLLSTNDAELASKIADELEIFNRQRKEIEARVLEEAIAKVEKDENNFGKGSQLLFAVGHDWHPGVIGIVASRLKEIYNRPVAVITLLTDDNGNKIGKASCRSIFGVDFGAAILKARLKNLLLDGGGHAMAAGFSVHESFLKELHDYFLEILSADIIENSQSKINEFLDILDLENINIELIKELAQLEPFGVANQKPRFIIRNLYKVQAGLIGASKNHISCIFAAKNPLGFNSNIKAVAFGQAGSSAHLSNTHPLADILINSNYSGPFHIAGQLNINSWMGVENIQLIIEDVLT